MDWLLDLADSEVAAVVDLADGLCLRFSAAAVRQRTGALAGHARGVELLLGGVSPPRPPLEGCLGRLAQGRVTVDGQWLPRLALPGEWRAAIELDLTFANHSALCLRGRSLVCRFVGEANCRESLAC